MSEIISASPSKTEKLALKAKELDLRLKELEKENVQRRRPGAFRSSVSNPVVIAAIVAGWATLSAAGLTLLSGWIATQSQREAAHMQAEAAERKFEADATAAERKFEADLIAQAAKTDDPFQAALNLKFWLDTGLLRGDIGEKVQKYLAGRTNNPFGEGLVKPRPNPRPSAR
jgi:hypothetical protein